MNINDTRWQAWTDKFLSSRKSPTMTQKEAQAYMSLMLQPDDEFAEVFASVEAPFPLKVFDAHAGRIGLLADPKVRVFISCVVADRAGTVVMYVHALRRLQQKSDLKRPLNMKDLHTQADSPFASGYLPEVTLHALWDEQKDEERGGNYLDRVTDA